VFIKITTALYWTILKMCGKCGVIITPGVLTHWHTTFYNTWRTYKY